MCCLLVPSGCPLNLDINVERLLRSFDDIDTTYDGAYVYDADKLVKVSLRSPCLIPQTTPVRSGLSWTSVLLYFRPNKKTTCRVATNLENLKKSVNLKIVWKTWKSQGISYKFSRIFRTYFIHSCQWNLLILKKIDHYNLKNEFFFYFHIVLSYGYGKLKIMRKTLNVI